MTTPAAPDAPHAPVAPDAPDTSSDKPAQKKSWKVDVPECVSAQPLPNNAVSHSREKDWKSEYPVHAAAQGGELNTLRSLLEKEDNLKLVNAADDDTWTPLHYSSW